MGAQRLLDYLFFPWLLHFVHQCSLFCSLNSNVEPRKPHPQKKSTPQSSEICKGCRWVPAIHHCFFCIFIFMRSSHVRTTGITHRLSVCVCHREVIDKVMERYSQSWERQEDNYQKFRYKNIFWKIVSLVFSLYQSYIVVHLPVWKLNYWHFSKPN